jgi:hypothetical protein
LEIHDLEQVASTRRPPDGFVLPPKKGKAERDSSADNIFQHIKSLPNNLLVWELQLGQGDLTRFPSWSECVAMTWTLRNELGPLLI